MRLLAAALRKLARRPASWVVALILLAILALFYLALGASANQIPDERQRAQIETFLRDETAVRVLLGFLLGLGGLLALAYAGAVGGAEWTWGTLRVVVARGESRSRYVLTTFAAIAIVVLLGLIVAFAVGLALLLLASAMAGVPAPSLSGEFLAGLPGLVGLAWLGLVEQAAIGFGVATVARSQLAGVGAGIALYVLEQFVSVALPQQSRYLPFTVSSSLVATPEQAATVGTQLLDPALSLGLTAAYLVLALGIAALVTETAEITG
ncbi:MAG TPA: hypothetical protein VGQ47_01810 [Candidatus Limnocylindrales bacterium]|nr:hypothetical protein [Candidatus Limnocylindrales bacterium]